MEENRARHVMDVLREKGVDAHIAREGVYQFGVRACSWVPCRTRPPVAAPLPRLGGVFRRFFDGFRYR
jgi:hypothetical protein